MAAKLISAFGAFAHLFSFPITMAKRREWAVFRRPPCAAAFKQADGLSKLQAEELLDCLEAHGIHDCQASYQPGQGFTVFRK